MENIRTSNPGRIRTSTRLALLSHPEDNRVRPTIDVISSSQ